MSCRDGEAKNNHCEGRRVERTYEVITFASARSFATSQCGGEPRADFTAEPSLFVLVRYLFILFLVMILSNTLRGFCGTPCINTL